MKLKIATRVFIEEYLIYDFLNYHLNLGVDEIHLFDSYSTDKTMDIIKDIREKDERVVLVESNVNLRHTGYYQQSQVISRVP